MKNIDIKSLIIGVLLTSTIFLGVASTGKTDKWDDDQRWEILIADTDGRGMDPEAEGAEGRYARSWLAAEKWGQPFAIQGKNMIFRRRVK